LTPKEEHQLLKVFNDTQVEYPKDKTVIDLFEEQVKNNPEHIAVVFEENQLNYKDLDKRSNQLARYLRKNGVKGDVLVGICLERSIEMIVGILGILKAGGAYVPIDPEYPSQRINYMIEDAKLEVLLTTSKAIKAVQDAKLNQIIKLDSQWEEIAIESSRKLPKITLPNHLAYVIYTSGSTGKPKGVMIE
ncbi:AMP-binding protein, partial [Aquimarina addita]|uniref:AMP-binding protein n=1 Tax=Aquimarina addita TaxID=870485 RepID=UPI0031EDBDDE